MIVVIGNMYFQMMYGETSVYVELSITLKRQCAVSYDDVG
jgi:hypothetical protein